MGPAGEDLFPEGAKIAISSAKRVFLRTERHPAAQFVRETSPVEVATFDHIYDSSSTFAEVYDRIVEQLVAAALEQDGPGVVYVVPGSPLVTERTVELLRSDDRVELVVMPAISFLDLAWDRLGVDPVSSSVRLVDGMDFAAQAAGERGPLLVAQTHSRSVLSSVKLAIDDPPPGEAAAILLHHLGLDDEIVAQVRWSELDRQEEFEPDHLTSVWIPTLQAPVAGEIVKLVELVRTLRAKCPWDQRQTHGSLGRHLLEESYEVLDAIEDLAAAEPDVSEEIVTHLEEELGDLAFQVVFHSVLASEEGRFTLADVARRVVDKLVGRHPHVFGDAVAHTPEDVAKRWEMLKREEQGRSSVTDGIPRTLPSLALAAKLQRKAESVGLADQGPADDRRLVLESLDRLARVPSGSTGETLEAERSTVADVGEALLALSDLARRAGVDPESALRARCRRLLEEIREAEGSGPQGLPGTPGTHPDSASRGVQQANFDHTNPRGHIT
jgi:tetrapyrrole methylase family protein/MazG family protein